MSGGFSSPIIGGGGGLVYPQIKSPDFSLAGQTGWAILKNGNAYFFNLTATGTITAATIIGALIENSAANPKTAIAADGSFKITNAAGQVIFQIAADGTVTWFSAAGAQLMQMSPAGFISITDPAFFEFPSGAVIEGAAANLASTVDGSGAAQFLQMLLSGPKLNVAGHEDWVQLQLNSANDGGTSDANGELVYIDTGGTPHLMAFWDGTGFNAIATITAAHPGSSPAVSETWQTLTLVNSYTAGVNPGGFTDVPQIRLMADNQTLQLKGALTTPNPVTSHVFAAVPASYPNANLGGNYGLGLVANFAGGQVDHIQVQNNGNLSLHTAPAGITFDISCIVPTQ